MTPVQTETFAELSRTVLGSLYNVDKRGYEHKVSFKAQDDDWGEHCQARTGIPLTNLEKVWKNLPDWDADWKLHPRDS